VIRVAGELLEGFAGVSVRRSLDRVSECAFSVTWDPRNETLRRLFPPLSQQELTVGLSGGEELLTGWVVANAPQNSEDSRSLPLAGYGRPGALEGGRLEGTKEFRSVRFGQIAQQIASPFGVEVDMRGEEGASFATVSLKGEKAPWGFLAELAAERNLLLTDAPSGRLVGWAPVAPGSPVLELTEGAAPLGSIGVTISSDWYSEVIGTSGATRGRGGSVHREPNPFYRGPPKPLTFEAKDTAPADLPRAVQAKLGRVIGNAMAWTAQVPGLRDPSGAIFRPNTTISVLAPSVHLYRRTELLVRDVEFSGAEDGLSTDLTLVLPGSFGGPLPSSMPWDN